MIRFLADENFNGPVLRGLPMPGVIEVPNHLTFRQVIDDLELIAGAARDGEYEGQVAHLPLQRTPF